MAPVAAAVVEDAQVEQFPQTRAERRAQRRRERGGNEDEQGFSVLIVRHEENLSGLSVFVTDTGEILDQINTTSSRFPEPPFAADMEPASRASYWLSAPDGGRPVRVVYRD